MANATVTRLGQINGAGAVDALFLKVFGGEVLTTFHNTNVMMDKHRVREISAGKSAQFPVIGTAQAQYHTPGTELVGQVINQNEKVISIDDLLVADVFIASIDEAMNHYDVREPFSTELGTVLANTFDSNVQQVLVLAARAAANVTGGYGGTQLTNAAYATDGVALANGLFDAAQVLDEHEIPENDRYCNMRPAQYYLMARTPDVINRDWGGRGAYAEGEVLKVAGVAVVKTTRLPSTNVTTGPAAYQGDFTNTQFAVYHKSAVGTVRLLDLGIEAGYDIRRQGTLIVAKYAVGHGILRPEAAVEGKSA